MSGMSGMSDIHNNNMSGAHRFNPNDIFKDFFGTNNVFDINDDFIHMDHDIGYNTGYNTDCNTGHNTGHNMKSKRRSSKLKKGESCHKEILCTLEELYNGKIKKFKITRKIYKNHKIVTEIDTLDIEIKPGYKEGTKITFKEKGDIQPNQLPGDIVFIVKEDSHNIFKRNNNDIYVTCPISLNEAVNGFHRILKILSVEPISFKVPKLKKSSDTHIVKNNGMPIRKGGRHIGYGNLVIKFDINLN
jgi:DnaJ family protein B protein 4